MSKWIELLKLVPKGLKNPQQVVEGVINNINLPSLSEEEQIEIARRRLICAQCPNMSGNKEGAKKKGFDYCTLCSCPIVTKTAALSAICGAKTYNEKHPEAPEPILWTSFEKEK